jgi:hypothetical protein
MRRVLLALILVVLISEFASANVLSEALDTNLVITTGGDVDWFLQTMPYFNDYDAAQSGDIGDDQVSWMRTTVQGAGTLSFYWKVSSERHYDDLKFFIDGVLQDRISETVDWHQMTYEITASGLHTLEWRYVKDYSASRGDDSGWVDFVEWSGSTESPAEEPLSQALDTSLNFTTDGDAKWFFQTAKAFFDDDAAQSGGISHNQESWMQTLVSGTGTFSFYWKVSSEAGYDFLEFYIDGVLQDRISGSEGWQKMTYAITAPGLHTLEWRYIKDNNVSEGDDSGWIDLVEWSGSTEPPAESPLSQALDTSLNLTTDSEASWFYQTDISYFDGDAAQSGAVLDNQESWMQTLVSGTGTFSFYWKVSSEAGFDCLEFYIDGVLMDRISGTEEWHQMTYTITESGSHTLRWRYVKDYSITAGGDCGWVDRVVWSVGTPSVGPLSQALDTSLSLTTDGNASWFSQTDISYFDDDAAQSGAVSHNQESWMQTLVSGTGTFSFYWKVSSEAGFDCLEFYIDDILQDRISGIQDWHKMMYTITGSGLHTLEWRYMKDYSESAGKDAGWIDLVEWSNSTKPPSDASLSQALDTSSSLTTDGDASWFSQTDVSYFDDDAAQSGAISHNQESWMQALVSGMGTFSFYWKVSSETGYDFLEFYIDDVFQDSISGMQDWYQVTCTIAEPGLHTLQWRYVKDGNESGGDDCGWVDKLEWQWWDWDEDWWIVIR